MKDIDGVLVLFFVNKIFGGFVKLEDEVVSEEDKEGYGVDNNEVVFLVYVVWDGVVFFIVIKCWVVIGE